MSAYEIVKKMGHGMSFSQPMKMADTVCFEIIHSETKEHAWSSSTMWADSPARSIGGLRLSASKMIKRYEYHLQKHGTRFEVTEREAKAARYLAKKKTERLVWLERNIPVLINELALAKADAVFDLKTGKFVAHEVTA